MYLPWELKCWDEAGGKGNSRRKYGNIAVGPLFPNPALSSTISGFYSLRRNVWQTEKSSCICWQIEDYSQVHYLNPTSGGRKTALICQASGLNASQIPSVDRNVHPVRTQTCWGEGPSLLLHKGKISDLHGQRASPQVLTVCKIQGGHPIVVNVNNNNVDTVQYGSLLLHKRAPVVEIQLCVLPPVWLLLNLSGECWN